MYVITYIIELQLNVAMNVICIYSLIVLDSPSGQDRIVQTLLSKSEFCPPHDIFDIFDRTSLDMMGNEEYSL